MIGIGVFGDDYEKEAAEGAFQGLSQDVVIQKLQGSPFAGTLHTKDPAEIEKAVEKQQAAATMDHLQVIALTKTLITIFE